MQGNIDVALELAPELWAVDVDPNELELALLNLAVNARDAMPEGGRLTLAADNARDADAEFVALRLTDTGEGMTAETLARAVEPFFTTKETGKGSGLGLAQVHGFARSSGGQVRLESAPGAGTTVEMLLPRSRGVPAAETRSSSPVEVGACSLHVLVVEDSDAVAGLLAGMLEELGHVVRRVESATEALRALDAPDRPDLVVSDVMMPGGMDGMGLAREIRRRHAGLPVVLASGRADAVREAAAAAAVPLLGKPFAIADLAAAIAQARAGAPA